MRAKKSLAYYNEFDPYAAQWLRNLIEAGHIAPGDVDERDMQEVKPHEIKGYTQHHFFAGIGGWSLALRLAGWPDERPVLTGSPPCQPFSSAGKRLGVKDERHLAPHFLSLVAALRPPVVFGEQVAAAVRKDNWLDDLLNALEGEGYATGAIVLPACGVGAPHIRQRLWFTARLDDTGCSGRAAGTFTQRSVSTGEGGEKAEWSNPREEVGGGCKTSRLDESKADGPQSGEELHGEHHRQKPDCGRFAGRLADAERSQRRTLNQSCPRVEGEHTLQRGWQENPSGHAGGGPHGGMADAGSERRQQEPSSPLSNETQDGAARRVWREPDSDYEPTGHGEGCRSGPNHGGWNSPDWLFCQDGKWRPVESGTFPLAHGVSNRVGRLRAYGNAIVPQVAAEVLKAWGF